MTIDIHTHLAYHKIYPEAFFSGLLDNGASSNPILMQKQLKLIKLLLRDKEGDSLVKQMNESDIHKSVLLIIDDNGFIGNSICDLEKSYELHHKILKKYPKRFYVFAGFHPFRKNGFDLLRKGIEEYGFNGIKLYPPFNFRIDCDEMQECYEYANKMELPILSHTGFSMDSLVNEYASPHHFLNVVDLYPKVKFVLAHAGYKLDDLRIVDLLDRENVYGDISGFSRSDEEILKKIFSPKFNNKILFGSDWPINNMMKPTSTLIEKVKKVYNSSGVDNIRALENVLFRNAEMLLQRKS